MEKGIFSVQIDQYQPVRSRRKNLEDQHESGTTVKETEEKTCHLKIKKPVSEKDQSPNNRENLQKENCWR